MSRMGGDAGKDIGQPGLRTNAVNSCRLCRPPNYAERVWYGSPCHAGTVDRVHGSPIPFGIVWSFRAPPERRAGGRSAGSGFACRARTA